MTHESPADKFLAALDAHIEACVSKTILPHQRLHERERAAAQVASDERYETSKADLTTAVADLLKDFRRPGI